MAVGVAVATAILVVGVVVRWQWTMVAAETVGMAMGVVVEATGAMVMSMV